MVRTVSTFRKFDIPSDDAESLAAARRHLRQNAILPVLDILGDRWTLRLLRELHYGVHRFDNLQQALDIARSTLSNRLDDLVHHGLVEKRRYQGAPARYEYHLTQKGLDTCPIIFSIERWDRTWGPEPADDRYAEHATCGHTFEARLACNHCGGLIRARDVKYQAGPGAGSRPPSLRRRPRRRTKRDGATDPITSAAEILGDRWTALVVATAWFGIRRFSDIEQAIEIAPNILSRRLSDLTACGIFARHIYQERPRRSKYILTEKGFDLYPMTVSLLAWGDRWCAPRGRPPLLLQHETCGAELQPTLFCGACNQPASLDELRMAPF